MTSQILTRCKNFKYMYLTSQQTLIVNNQVFNCLISPFRISIFRNKKLTIGNIYF